MATKTAKDCSASICDISGRLQTGCQNVIDKLKSGEASLQLEAVSDLEQMKKTAVELKHVAAKLRLSVSPTKPKPRKPFFKKPKPFVEWKWEHICHPKMKTKEEIEQEKKDTQERLEKEAKRRKEITHAGFGDILDFQELMDEEDESLLPGDPAQEEEQAPVQNDEGEVEVQAPEEGGQDPVQEEEQAQEDGSVQDEGGVVNVEVGEPAEPQHD